MRPDDLREIVRIDRAITGRDRGDYIAARLAEAMDDSAIRVSLAARLDGAIVGFVMARADLGDFGRTEPVAVVDTIGIDPEYAHRGLGHALLAQLFANLSALQVERVETVVPTARPGAAGVLPDARASRRRSGCRSCARWAASATFTATQLRMRSGKAEAEGGRSMPTVESLILRGDSRKTAAHIELLLYFHGDRYADSEQ